MKQLFIIESPLQLLNAYEALNTFPADQQIIIVRYSGVLINDNQIDKTLNKLDLFKLAKIKYVQINVDKRTTLDIFKMLWLKLFYLFTIRFYETVFVGNYESKFIHFIIPFNVKKIILLDDGNLTLKIQENFTTKKYFNWFTVFDLVLLKNQISVKNKYKYLNLHLIKGSKQEDLVLFIGTGLCEYEIITEEYNLELLKKISNRYFDKEIIYVAHRSENNEKLSTINKIFNIKVIRFEYPIELFSVNNDYFPTLIASFYSSALITLEKIYGVEIVAFKFDYTSSSFKDEIDLVYKYYEKSFKIIEEENI